MKEIGGYFELELPPSKSDFIHSECIFTNSGRHALEYILRALGNRVSKIYLPYYTCEVVLQPIERLGLDYEFYHINSNLEIDKVFTLKEGEYIIVNNYFGIKDKYINEIAVKYGSKLIVDNSQAWYAKEQLECNGFYSPRKFFGLPDGGVAWSNHHLIEELKQDYSSTRCFHLLKRIDESASAGYCDFKVNSHILNKEPLKRMSKLSYRILSAIDFELIKKIRISNYLFLEDKLSNSNLLKLPSIESFECPMVYPYMTENENLRKKLISNKIFVATYWSNVLDWCSPETLEYNFAKSIIPLPIDQRYNEDDMTTILKLIMNK